MDSHLTAIIDLFVRPFYMSFLHGNLRYHDGQLAAGFPERVGQAARDITNEDLTRLFSELEWRGRLTAAWFVGLTRRPTFVEQIGQFLLASELCFSGQGYCLALALIGGRSCDEYLCAYLARYLPLQGRQYDQLWAIGALAHIRRREPLEFLDSSLWKDDSGDLDPRCGIEDFTDLIDYLTRYRLVAAQPGVAADGAPPRS